MFQSRAGEQKEAPVCMTTEIDGATLRPVLLSSSPFDRLGVPVWRTTDNERRLPRASRVSDGILFIVRPGKENEDSLLLFSELFVPTLE
jgi:hypothetical protein